MRKQLPSSGGGGGIFEGNIEFREAYPGLLSHSSIPTKHINSTASFLLIVTGSTISLKQVVGRSLSPSTTGVIFSMLFGHGQTLLPHVALA